MIRFPSPPVVASTFSGFIVGVLVTLLATGVFSHTTHSSTPIPTPTAPPPVADSSMLTRITKIVKTQLGPTVPGQHYPRLVSVQLDPAAPGVDGTGAPARAAYRSVYITFNLNDHPLGAVWRLRAAKADVFAIMKALYTSGLRVYNTRMIGHFQQKNGQILNRAISVGLDYRVAAQIPWKKWGRENEERLWRTLTFAYTDPRFA